MEGRRGDQEKRKLQVDKLKSIKSEYGKTGYISTIQSKALGAVTPFCQEWSGDDLMDAER